MDDQRTNREGRSIKRLFQLLLIWLPITGVGAFLAVIASLGIGMAIDKYDPKMAMFFVAASLGFFYGVGMTIATMQVIRRCNLRLTHFKVRHLLALMTGLAIVFGLISYVINKK
jgi:hypothetical protein